MAREKAPKSEKETMEHDGQLKDLAPRAEQVVGGHVATKHPAKVTVPEIKF